MANENRLIRVGKAVHDMCNACSVAAPGIECKPKHCSLVDALRNIPSVDAVEVVRCRECANTCPGTVGIVCTIWGNRTAPDGFCYMGERKKDQNSVSK